MIQRYRGTKTQLLASITDAEKAAAMAIARSKGMTFSGWLGQLIKRELEKSRHEQLSADP